MTERQPDNGEKSVGSRHSPSKIRVNSLFLNCKFCDNPVTLETVGLDRVDVLFLKAPAEIADFELTRD